MLFAGSGWLPGRDQVTFAVTNQIRPPHAFQGSAQQGAVVGIMVAQEGFMQPALSGAFGNVYLFTLMRHFGTSYETRWFVFNNSDISRIAKRKIYIYKILRIQLNSQLKANIRWHRNKVYLGNQFKNMITIQRASG